MMPDQTVSALKPWKLSPAASSHLNMARGLAALAVASDHVRNLFWVDYGRVQIPHAALGILYLLTGLGHEAVMVFFVLSGFFISASVFNAGSKTWCVRSYIIDRLSRLYIVLFPALILGAVFDGFTRTLPGSRTYFFGPIEHFGPAFEAGFTLKAFLGNLAFVQETLVPAFGSNGPLWSLANEFWYYVFWGLVCLLFLGLTLRRRVIGALLLASCLAMVSRSIWLGLPIWLMGTAVHVLPRHKFLSRRGASLSIWPLALTLFGLVLCLSKKGFLGDWGDYLIGAAFTLLLYVTVQFDLWASPLYSRVAKFFADFSFSLYVSHFPILILVRTMMWKYPPFQPSVYSGSILVLILLTVLVTGYLFSRGTEAFTGVLRSRLQSLFLLEKNRVGTFHDDPSIRAPRMEPGIQGEA
jgi:peptidoglycan/LPS O-acetylase OafA/YrhL